MPDVKVYIRKENMEKWLNIEKPSLWINTLLSNSEDTSSYGRTIDTPVGPAVTVLAETLPLEDKPFVPRPPDPITGYPCCTKNKPCKHWVWDSGEVVWVNSLTGEIRDE